MNLAQAPYRLAVLQGHKLGDRKPNCGSTAGYLTHQAIQPEYLLEGKSHNGAYSLASCILVLHAIESELTSSDPNRTFKVNGVLKEWL